MYHKQNYALENVPAPCHAERPRSTRTIRATSGTQKHPRAMSCGARAKHPRQPPLQHGLPWMLRSRSAWHGAGQLFQYHEREDRL